MFARYGRCGSQYMLAYSAITTRECMKNKIVCVGRGKDYQKLLNTCKTKLNTSKIDISLTRTLWSISG